MVQEIGEGRKTVDEIDPMCVPACVQHNSSKNLILGQPGIQDSNVVNTRIDPFERYFSKNNLA